MDWIWHTLKTYLSNCLLYPWIAQLYRHVSGVPSSEGTPRVLHAYPGTLSPHLDGSQDHLHYSALSGRQALGIFSNHVLLENRFTIAYKITSSFSEQLFSNHICIIPRCKDFLFEIYSSYGHYLDDYFVLYLINIYFAKRRNAKSFS